MLSCSTEGLLLHPKCLQPKREAENHGMERPMGCRRPPREAAGTCGGVGGMNPEQAQRRKKRGEWWR